uniref:Uncharacterized protein n=1 Tax=Arundo donax TaxID=35708 RepID=A0A0A8Y0B8_ARUDO
MAVSKSGNACTEAAPGDYPPVARTRSDKVSREEKL